MTLFISMNRGISILAMLAISVPSWAGADQKIVLRGQQLKTFPAPSTNQRLLKRPASPPTEPSPTPPPSPAGNSQCTGADGDCKSRDAPVCCEGFTCTNVGGGSKTCVSDGGDGVTTTTNTTTTTTTTTTVIPTTTCPSCIADFGGSACGCTSDWSTSSLQCITDPDPPESELLGYSSVRIAGADGQTLIAGTYIFTNTFSAGYACHDGVGGYYSGSNCYFAHNSVCSCQPGYVWTNAQACLPLECDPIATPTRCICTLDNSCEL